MHANIECWRHAIQSRDTRAISLTIPTLFHSCLGITYLSMFSLARTSSSSFPFPSLPLRPSLVRVRHVSGATVSSQKRRATRRCPNGRIESRIGVFCSSEVQGEFRGELLGMYTCTRKQKLSRQMSNFPCYRFSVCHHAPRNTGKRAYAYVIVERFVFSRYECLYGSKP